MFVGAQNVLFSGEGADEHQQGGLGQVEVSKHRFDDSEFMAWINEEISGGSTRNDGSCTHANGVFKSSNRCGADRDDAARITESLIDGSS
jgi:hypothetical protein